MRRVIKVGGSLLLRPDLVPLVTHWIESQPTGENLIIVGGGELIDAIRHLDAIEPADASETHWRCVRLLDHTFEHLIARAPTWNVVSEGPLEPDKVFSQDTPTLIRVGVFYSPDAQAPMPHDWRTTTDAIAAFLAHRLGADEAVLLKACEIPASASIPELIQQRIVDEAITMAGYPMSQIRFEQLSPNPT
ncbi:amino acid kinase family protein [Stieleria varia]|uniref:Amino acid kinase family protein n=1 Tax=Stieleria varia TaxID=2528005 RepID=A0A5C6B1C6_9BACT|nr:protein kinase [Stieleria varia]TWU04224.1 Amino acid kinase family protein [Stieleria varia]